MIAAKFFDDKYYNNEYYAKVGGINKAEINLLEIEFLFLLDFALHVSSELFFSYSKKLLEDDNFIESTQNINS